MARRGDRLAEWAELLGDELPDSVEEELEEREDGWLEAG